MRIRSVAILATVASALILVPTAALAHAELTSSTPAGGSTLAEAPEEVRLVFDGELIPDGTGFTVVDAQGSTVGSGTLDLDVADRNEVSGPVRITAEGTYTVQWTSASLDGHAADGELRFEVDLRDAAESPDTATRTQGDTPTVIGALLVLGALCILTRRVAGRA